MTEIFRVSKAQTSEIDEASTEDKPGRWNFAGEKIAYTSGSRAMAVLEALVHLEPGKPRDYVLRKATIPKGICILYPDDHPAKLAGFRRALKDIEASRNLGSEWLQRKETVVLAVPSVLVPDEFNYLINPAHPDFSKITLSDPEPYEFDDRLWMGSGSG